MHAKKKKPAAENEASQVPQTLLFEGGRESAETGKRKQVELPFKDP